MLGCPISERGFGEKRYVVLSSNVILNLDELVNDLMLQTALNVNLKNPLPTIAQLSQLQDAKIGLNSIMKYVDSSK